MTFCFSNINLLDSVYKCAFNSVWVSYIQSYTMGSYEDAEAVCKLIKSKVPYTPLIGIVCGSGLGTLAETVQNKITIKYSEIEQFPKSTGMYFICCLCF